MSDVGPWTKFGDDAAVAPPSVAAPAEEGPWTKFAAEAKPGKDAGLYSRFLSGFTSDKQEQVRMLADRLFPGEPLDKSVQRFSEKGGKLVYRGDDGETYHAMPEGGWRGMVGDILQGTGKSLPVAAGAGAGMATLPLATTGVGLAATMAAAGGGAAVGEVARQKLGDILLGRASTGDLNKTQIVREAAESGLGQGIGLGAGAMMTRGAVRDISKFDPVKTNQNYSDAAKVGVDLTPAEATGLPTLASQQKRLTNITATSDEMRDFLKARDDQVLGAWGGFLDKVSKASDAEDVGKLARDTAQNVFGEMRKKLAAEAKPYYDAAKAADVPFTKEMKDMLDRPIMQQAMDKAEQLVLNDPNATARKFFMKRGPDGRFTEQQFLPNMEQWDYVKRGLDEILGSDAVKNQTTGGMNNLGRIVQANKRELLDLFDNPKSKSYVPEYKAARDIYQDGVEDVSNAMQSALKIVADSKDTNVLQAARHVFDPRTRSPQMVGTLRSAIEGEDPAAWQALKRLYMQDVTADALRITETGDINNPAGKIFKAFSAPKVAANLRAAMTPDEQDNFQEIMSVFRRAASVPALRSDTEFNRLISVKAESEAQPLLAKAAGAVKALNPANENFLGLKTLQESLTNRNLDKQAAKVVELVTSGDPDAIAKMRELRKIGMGTRQGLAVFGQLLARGSAAAGEYALTGGDNNPGQ